MGDIARKQLIGMMKKTYNPFIFKLNLIKKPTKDIVYNNGLFSMVLRHNGHKHVLEYKPTSNILIPHMFLRDEFTEFKTTDHITVKDDTTLDMFSDCAVPIDWMEMAMKFSDIGEYGKLNKFDIDCSTYLMDEFEEGINAKPDEHILNVKKYLVDEYLNVPCTLTVHSKLWDTLDLRAPDSHVDDIVNAFMYDASNIIGGGKHSIHRAAKAEGGIDLKAIAELSPWPSALASKNGYDGLEHIVRGANNYSSWETDPQTLVYLNELMSTCGLNTTLTLNGKHVLRAGKEEESSLIDKIKNLFK
jgi:hypothetical protein